MLFLFLTRGWPFSPISEETRTQKKVFLFWNGKSHSDPCHVNFLSVSGAVGFLVAPSFSPILLHLGLCRGGPHGQGEKWRKFLDIVSLPPSCFFHLLENDFVFLLQKY